MDIAELPDWVGIFMDWIGLFTLVFAGTGVILGWYGLKK